MICRILLLQLTHEGNGLDRFPYGTAEWDGACWTLVILRVVAGEIPYRFIPVTISVHLDLDVR